jgi:hypothetical protein
MLVRKEGLLLEVMLCIDPPATEQRVHVGMVTTEVGLEVSPAATDIPMVRGARCSH